MPSILGHEFGTLRNFGILGVSKFDDAPRTGESRRIRRLWHYGGMTLLTLEFGLHDYMRKSLEVAGIGVGEMAGRLGVSIDTVSRWINGRNKPSTPALMTWAMVTGVDYAVFEECARRDSNPQPSDWESRDPSCDICGSRFHLAQECTRYDDAIEVEHQLLLLAEAVEA
jgi:transcriptional regulator with XRE-family HTH domain